MKFDVVIGNPPYNKDMYLSFVSMAYNLLKTDGEMVMITPAKWYAKSGKDNETFRKFIVPYMKEIHVYKCCTDVFDIADRGGIAYYNIYKNKIFNTKLVQQHSQTPDGKALAFKTELEEHTEQPLELISLAALNIISKCKQVAGGQALFKDDFPIDDSYYCSRGIEKHSNKSVEPNVTSYELLGGKDNTLQCVGYLYNTDKQLRRTTYLDKYRSIMCCMMSGKGFQLDKNGQTIGFPDTNFAKPGQVASYTTLYVADTLSEIESFNSYFQSSLVKFIASQCWTSNASDSKDTWRHVPALPTGYKFDHIYTNEEIFKIFELTDEEIKLITNLIKPRKEK